MILVPSDANPRRPRRRLAAPAIAVAATFLFFGAQASLAGGARVSSQWTTAPVEVDGDLADWAGGLAFMPDDDFTLGVRNDSEFVYVALMFDDPRLGMRALMNGLTVWFDPEGAADASVGVRFPIAARELMPASAEGGDSLMARPSGHRGPPREGDDAGRGGAFRDPERVRVLLDRASYELDLVDGEGGTRRLGMDDARKTEGVVAAIGESKRVIACEFRIPLQSGEGRATAIGANAGDTFGLRIESEALGRGDRPARRGGFGGPPGGDVPGGNGGFGGGRGGRRGPPPGGEGAGPSKPLAFKVEVVIATGD